MELERCPEGPARRMAGNGAFRPPSVGMISGLGPVVFRALIGRFRNLLLVVHWSFDYDAMGNPSP